MDGKPQKSGWLLPAIRLSLQQCIHATKGGAVKATALVQEGP